MGTFNTTHHAIFVALVATPGQTAEQLAKACDMTNDEAFAANLAYMVAKKGATLNAATGAYSAVTNKGHNAQFAKWYKAAQAGGATSTAKALQQAAKAAQAAGWPRMQFANAGMANGEYRPSVASAWHAAKRNAA